MSTTFRWTNCDADPGAGRRRSSPVCPGRRFVFTNADDKHARTGVGASGAVPKACSRMSSTSAPRAMWPKPSAGVVRADRGRPRHHTDARRFSSRTPSAISSAAKAIGMTTVLMGAHAPASTAAFVDYRPVELTFPSSSAALPRGAHLDARTRPRRPSNAEIDAGWERRGRARSRIRAGRSARRWRRPCCVSTRGAARVAENDRQASGSSTSGSSRRFCCRSA